MRKIKIKLADGTEQEIEVPEGFLSPDEVKAQYMPKSGFEAELNRRSESITNKKLSELEGDDEFFNKLLEKRGVALADPKKESKLTTDQLKEAQAQWEKKVLEPIKQQLEQEKGRSTKLLDASLNSEILSAAAEAGVLPALLKAPAAGQPAMIVNMLRGMFGYDEKTNGFYVKKGDSFEFSSSPSEESGPYKRVSEFLKDWSADKGNKPFITDRRQDGPGLNNGNPNDTKITPSGGRHVISRADAGDMLKYKAAKSAAEKAGVQLVIAEQ
jgi:hypothetical protein